MLFPVLGVKSEQQEVAPCFHNSEAKWNYLEIVHKGSSRLGKKHINAVELLIRSGNVSAD